jgi:predicted phosphodiesterase
VLGDLHCDRRHLGDLIERAVEERCDALVSLGDLCYLPRDPEGRRFLRSAGALLRRAGLELLLVEGNHDDAEALALLCHDPRILEQGAQARGAFAALTAKLRPALVVYAHQHRPHVSAAGQPALIGLGSFRDGQSSALVLDSAETGRLVRALRRGQTAAQPVVARPVI